MQNSNPKFPVRVVKCVPAGNITHAIVSCPRCGVNMGVTTAMIAGRESIICKGRLNGGECNGHFYLRGNDLEFVGTAA